ncbi:hypothetical protein DLREEDagrD3_23100 [Denitratisoma sp. agr-D3]
MAETVSQSSLLTVDQHSRDSAGMTYVYPVVSRRAGGVSVGINLNPNNACNWRCIYCQVPDLKRGGPPPLDLRQLRDELTRLLADIQQGDFMARRVPPEARRLMDVAFSGNGEPTSAAEFGLAVVVVGEVLAERGLVGHLPVRLITNGSLLDRAAVRDGIAALARIGGEVWFKMDGARSEDVRHINGSQAAPERQLARLLACAVRCPTWVQSCFFMEDDAPPAEERIAAYVAMLERVSAAIRGVHLYGLARPSLQPGAERLRALPAAWFDALAARLKEKGLTVTVSP